MHPNRTQQIKHGLVVAHGHGLKIYIDRRHLTVVDGFGRQRRARRYHRTSKLQRLVIIGRSGYITLDALRWLHDTHAALVHLDTNGELIATSTANGPDLAGVRRQQALAADGPAGMQIAREVLAAKVHGQRALLAELPHGAAAAESIDQALHEIHAAGELRVLLRAEAQAADSYWQAWAALSLPFPRREIARVPKHWLTFGQRASLITGGPRTATNPAGAILNYLYALLEAETILACHTVGLDPGLGIFHKDRRDRDSLALDLMEATRPAVDAYLLALLTQRTLSAREFLETREGSCRITPRLAAELAGTCSVWRSHVGPVAEHAAHTLAASAQGKQPMLTPLTRRNQKQAWDQRAPGRRRRRSTAEFAKLPNTCRECGEALPDRRHRYCNQCRTQRFQEHGNAARERAAQVLAQLRIEQRDPAHGGQAGKIRGRKNAAHQAAVRHWTGARPDPEIFRSEILPGLRQEPIRDLVAASGLSPHYCSLIRLGKRVPHPRHWRALRALAS